MSRTVTPNAKKDDKIDTKFGVVTVLERKNGKIMVLIDDDITATFNEIEFFNDFVL
jgi:hypothetical protein